MAADTPAPERISSVLIEEEMKDAYLNYAMSVIVSRALPDVRDGLKPSQRRILATMRDLDLGPRAKTVKCGKIVGDCLGNYHPHGDQAVYQTLVRLGQDWALRYRLIEGQGNFGSVDGDPPAAYRYTEARMTEFSSLILDDLELDTVDFRPNYDDTRTEPTVLPSKFPNLLCNGSTGIAVGMATSIPPHNVREIVDALVHLIENPDCPVEALMKFVKGPDFPTGGTICGGQGIVDAYTTGRGLLTVRAKIDVEETKGRQSLIVREIPYNQNKARLIERIAELVKEEKIRGIGDLRDESNKDGMRIVIELQKDVEEQVILNQLYQHTPLQDTFSVILLALVNNRPQVMNLKELMEAFRLHRMEVIRRRTRHLLEKAEKEAHILEGLVVALAHIDEVIETIKKSGSPAEARKNLMERFSLSEIQAEAILQMRLQRLTGLEQDQVRRDLEALRVKIADYKAILADEQLVLDIIREDLFEIREKHGDERRTQIAGEVADFSEEELIPEEQMVVVISHKGYAKRVALDQYRRQRRGGQGVIGAETAEGDFIEHLFVASTHDYILFFSDKGKVYWQKVFDLPRLARAAKGRALVSMLGIAEGEKITAALPVADLTKGYLVLATERGVVKKTAMEEFGNPKRGGIVAIRLEEGDRLIGVKATDGQQELILGTRMGKALRFSEKDARPMGRATYGVTGIRLQANDRVVDFVAVDPGSTLLTVSEKGFGKRSAVDAYRLQRRGGQGIINIRITDKNGQVVGMKAVLDEDEVIAITSKGMTVRTRVKDLRLMGRATQGVRVMTLKEGDDLVSIARVASEEVDAVPKPAAPTPPPPVPEEEAEAPIEPEGPSDE